MPPPNDMGWNHKLAELLAFREVNGHTNVQRRNGSLGQWVMTQRKQYKYLQEGRDTHINQERIDALNGIGFKWKIDKRAIRGWDDRFNELVAFQEEYGHLNVPQKDGPLGWWVSTQRRHYRFVQEEKTSLLWPDRIDRMNQIGFQWRLK
jgi:fatty-acid desaturase|mmetsp:Transcript_28181/g.51336  ORF Transcript_28181/g.51336 Transcript_28181/m.51336 type:complete len:149 (-) Transcript_28181:189-635(-)